MKVKAKVLSTEDMKRVLNEQRLGFVASVCPDGTPNLSPNGQRGQVSHPGLGSLSMVLSKNRIRDPIGDAKREEKLEKRCGAHLKLTLDSWRVDQTYVKMKKVWMYP